MDSNQVTLSNTIKEIHTFYLTAGNNYDALGGNCAKQFRKHSFFLEGSLQMLLLEAGLIKRKYLLRESN